MLGKQYYIRCDRCGRITPETATSARARADARKLGWKRVPLNIGVKGLIVDYCPRCFAETSNLPGSN